MNTAARCGGSSAPPEPPITTERSPSGPTDRQATALPTVADGDAAIRDVLGRDDAGLLAVLAHDRAVRHLLRDEPNNGTAQQMRTLVAAARVARRRRTGNNARAGARAAVLALADLLAAGPT